MRTPAALLLDLLTGNDMNATDRRALALYVLALARRVRELEARPPDVLPDSSIERFPRQSQPAPFSNAAAPNPHLATKKPGQ
jgi:hypothetical protein